MHPELGRYGKPVLYGELAGTIGAAVMNSIFSPVAAAVLKTITGIALGWYGLQRLDENGVIAYQAGVRLLTSVVEQLSYPSESKAIIEDVQLKKPFYLRVNEWKDVTTGAN
jgi:sulfite exporter TauE/SafE